MIYIQEQKRPILTLCFLKELRGDHIWRMLATMQSEYSVFQSAI